LEIEVRLPQWGMGMQEGTVERWLKQEGEEVEAGEPIAEIEAAKTTEELEAPVTGTLVRILVAEDATVPVRALLAVIASESSEVTEPQPEEAGAPTTGQQAARGADLSPTVRSPRGSDGRRIAPRVRMLAAREGVDLDTVEGTGPGGQVSEADVRRAAAASTTVAAATSPVPSAGEAPALGQTIPLTGVRGTIATRMRDSLAQSAQLTMVSTADVTDLLEWRATRPADDRPTVTDLLVKACAIILRAHPGLNAHIDEDGIHLATEVHVGIATAVPAGLFVPVVRNADRLPLAAVSEARARLTERVRDGIATAEEISGSTFTITNLGGYPVDAFTPIINPPEVAILGVGRTLEAPHRTDDGIGWRRELTLSLTIDHRAVDGAPGAEFLQSLVETLADPSVVSGSE
jgi:pyruvate dehydrogenase E2 component (dihydrolipoamide acetyltransferase)